MAPTPALRAHVSLFVVAMILLVCSATGMLAGTFVHTLASRLSSDTSPNGPVISGTSPSGAATATTTEIAAASPTAGSDATAFTLSITLSTHTVSPGATFTVTVVATTNGAPVTGLTCSLRPPISGPPGLFSTWPAPVSTDASGQAIWTLTTPAVAPGTYGIEVDAVGGHKYEFHRYTTLQIV